VQRTSFGITNLYAYISTLQRTCQGILVLLFTGEWRLL
jgi:hypothetical protein